MENDMEAQREKRPLKHLQGLKGRVQNSLSGFLRACIVAALVMFQFAILIVLPFLLRQYASLFYLVMELCSPFWHLRMTAAACPINMDGCALQFYFRYPEILCLLFGEK